MNNSALRQVSALPRMEYEELKEMWDNLFDTPPQSHNKTYLIRRLAWRIQELAFGGLSDDAQTRLDDLKNRPDSYAKHDKALPPIGTQLIREYGGEEHRVTVLANGFEYKNVTYSSLSKVARKITGTRWSGPKFFGLK